MQYSICVTLVAIAAFAGPWYSTATRAEAPPENLVSTRRIEADVRYLADDLLEGREAGTRGYELAALYVAAQYRAIGLEPAGDDGTYFQRVPLLRGQRERDGARFAITRDGRTMEFAFETEFLPGVNYSRGAAEVTAPMVFVGQAVRAPQFDHDDLEGVEVKGRIAVVLDNAPSHFPNDQRAFYSSSREKLQELERLGAVGVIFLDDPVNESKRPWALDAPNWRLAGMRRLDTQGQPVDDFPGLGVRVTCNVKLAEAIFAGSPHTAAEVFAMLEKDQLRAFDLAGTATLASRARLDRVESRNVVARLPGRDPTLSTEHVVFTAHLDHLGVGAPHQGDAIYNGAQDNALGVATLLEASRQLAAASEPPRRSMLFIALTAEEKGLLGAFHFMAQPTVPPESIVANVNMDMPVLLTETADVIPIGIEHSTLDALAQRAVTEAGLKMTPDPQPEEVVFVRSDQYAFVRAGVPAIYLLGGVKPLDGGDGMQQRTDFLGQHYHLPSDDLSQPISWTAAARMARLNYRIGLAIGDAAERPAWKPGDFFGDKFGR